MIGQWSTKGDGGYSRERDATQVPIAKSKTTLRHLEGVWTESVFAVTANS